MAEVVDVGRTGLGLVEVAGGRAGGGAPSSGGPFQLAPRHTPPPARQRTWAVNQAVLAGPGAGQVNTFSLVGALAASGSRAACSCSTQLAARTASSRRLLIREESERGEDA